MTPLSALARDYGIQTSYYDSEHRRQTVSRESIIGVLRALGAIEEESDAGDALRERRLALWRRPIEPVFVAWDGLLEAIEVRLPASGDATLGWTIEMESGDTIEGSAQIADLAVTRRETLDGEEFAARRLTIDRRLPPGYHTLMAEVGGGS